MTRPLKLKHYTAMLPHGVICFFTANVVLTFVSVDKIV